MYVCMNVYFKLKFRADVIQLYLFLGVINSSLVNFNLSLKAYINVNFRTRKINRDTYKLTPTPILIFFKKTSNQAKYI